MLREERASPLIHGTLGSAATGEAVWFNDFEPFLADGRAVRAGSCNVVRTERAATAGAWTLAEGCWGAPNGRLLFAQAGQNAPTLVFHPRVRGRHAVRIGLFGKRAFSWRRAEQDYDYDGFGAMVTLGDDPHFTALLTERNEPGYEEVYFKTVDCTEDTRIEVANFGMPCFLSGIRLTPVSAPALPRRTGHLIGILDFADDVPFAHPRALAGAAAVRRHADLGFDMVMWKAANGTICEYHTKLGVQRHDDAPIAKLLREQDTLRQAAEEAKRLGVSLFAWSRLLRDPYRKGSAPPPTPFHAAHPEMVQTFKDGAESWRLSFAFPEARRYMISILCEMASCGVDGIFVDVLRHPPVARYDLPLVEAFKTRTGLDPREMPGDGTVEWLRFRCEAFTQFLRELRSALDALGGGGIIDGSIVPPPINGRRNIQGALCGGPENGGRRFPLYLRTMDLPWRNLEAGCDVETWIAERLADGIIFAPWCPLGDNYPERLDLRSYVRQAKGRVDVYGQVWRQSSGMQAEAMAADLYEQGVDGVAIYESNLAVTRSSMRERLWRFGYPKMCRSFRVSR